jgi:hypothetical protein
VKTKKCRRNIISCLVSHQGFPEMEKNVFKNVLISKPNLQELKLTVPTSTINKYTESNQQGNRE